MKTPRTWPTCFLRRAALIAAAALFAFPHLAASADIEFSLPDGPIIAGSTPTATATKKTSAIPFEARAGIVIKDAFSEGYLIWLDRGKTDGVSPGSAFDVSAKGIPAGTLWIDEALQYTSAGRLVAIKGCPNLSSGVTLSLVFKETARTLSLPLIAIPAGREIPALPGIGAGESDNSLLMNFLAWTDKKKTVRAPAFAPVPPDSVISELVTSPAAPAGPPKIEEKPEPAAETVSVDYDIKSSYFVEEGDCLHISPWPGADSGRNVKIGASLEIEYPGGGKISVKDRSIAALEMDYEQFLSKRGIRTKPDISPCILR